MSELVGKRIGDVTYVHCGQVARLSSSLLRMVESATSVAQSQSEIPYNVIKISERQDQVSFLSYQDLIETPFPALLASLSVNLGSRTATMRRYDQRKNPPILHRKELLLGKQHLRYEEFALLTRTLESLGLFGETARIGTKNEWSELLKAVGISLEGHVVVRHSKSRDSDAVPDVARHRTAMVRSSLSVPVQTLIRFGFLKPGGSLFDYGCGRGDDVALLTADGFEASGWDPYFAPEAERRTAQVVNLGYVLNVIENPAERITTVQKAFSFVEDVLIIAALIEGQKARAAAKRYRDGIITTRGTFQKYFHQSELNDLIESALGFEPVPVGPGLFVVFRSEEKRENFILNRPRRRSSLAAPTMRARKRLRITLEDDADVQMAEKVWRLSLDLGRHPSPREVPEDIVAWGVRKFGSFRRTVSWLTDHFGESELNQAAKYRRDSLLTYIALALFRQKKLRTLLSRDVKQETKRIFGSLSMAESLATDLLLAIADADMLADSCIAVADQGNGSIDAKGRLLVSTAQLELIPPEIRILVGIAEWLGGGLAEFDLIVISPRRAVVTFAKYRNFAEENFPVLEERLRANLARRSVKYLPEASNEPARVLVGKSHFVASLVDADPLAHLDAAIRQSSPQTIPKHNCTPNELAYAIGQTGRTWSDVAIGDFFTSLNGGRKAVTDTGHRILNHSILPSLDDRCGRFLKFRELVECGETQNHALLPNLPQQAETFGALMKLANLIIDPVIDEYGLIKLTYGFCSSELSRLIKRRVAPRADQHAAHELNRKGQPICKRLGAAVDFLVEFESMLEVAQWVVQNCEFDRLYFYGDDRPIHVSVGDENARYVALMKPRVDGGLIPASTKIETFLQLTPSQCDW
jgi:DNA phosphorothioation-associated putative methyltransferase